MSSVLLGVSLSREGSKLRIAATFSSADDSDLPIFHVRPLEAYFQFDDRTNTMVLRAAKIKEYDGPVPDDPSIVRVIIEGADPEILPVVSHGAPFVRFVTETGRTTQRTQRLMKVGFSIAEAIAIASVYDGAPAGRG